MRGAFALVTALLVLAACSQEGDHGGFGEPPRPVESPSASPPRASDGPPQFVMVSAPGGFRFEPEALEIRAGEVTEFELANLDDQEHTFVISELAVVMLAGAGQTVSTTVAIDPKNTGRLTYFCSIPGHRAAGMEGTIVVRA